jgi:sugar lactone lactonase YvrE
VTGKGTLPNATEIVGSYKFHGQCRSKGSLTQGTFDVHPCLQKLWVFDVDISRSTEFVPPFSNDQDAALVVGQPDFNTTSAGLNQHKLDGPTGGSFDKFGNLWVADEDNNRVLEFIPPFSNGMNASVVLGQPDFVSNASHTTQSGLNTPQGVAFDGSGNLWVAEFFNNRVVEFVPPFSNGMNASLVLGQTDFTSSSPATSQSGFLEPDAVSFDKSGNLWVAEFDNNRVLEFKPPFSNGMNASVVLGQADFTSAVAATTQTGLNKPSGLAADAAGNLFVADLFNRRVVEFVPPFSSGMAATLVLGQANFTSNASAVSQTGLEGPEQMGFDSSGNLFVSDPDASRVLEYAPPFSNGMAASLVLGQPDFTSSTQAAGTSGMTFPAGVALSPR